jgi:predicted permease
LRDVVFRRSAERGTDEEIRFHVEMETEKNMLSGLSPKEARRRALLAFGGMERHRESLRDGRRVPLVEALWEDVRNGARFVARDPLLSLVAALTIALGVGSATAVFSAVNALLVRPLPFAGAAGVVSIQEARSGTTSNGMEGMLIPYDRVLEYRAATGDVLESVAGHRLVANYSLRLADVTVSVNGALTSGNYFETLGVRPALGRAYASDNADEIVISDRLWSARFGRDPGVVGRAVGLDGRRVVIVGVGPPGFGGATVAANDVWAPLGIRGVGPRSWSVRMVPLARLRPDVSRSRAAAVVDRVARDVPPREESTVRGATLAGMTAVPADFRGPVAGFFGMILGMALLVLLIAASNIAGVMLVRGMARQRELAVRVAIGASRSRVVRHLLVESLMVFALGGLLGVGLAYFGTAWLSRIELPPQLPPLSLRLRPDAGVLAFAVAITGLTGLLFGLVPALRSSRPDLVPALKTGVPGAIGGGSAARGVFVGAQVTLAATLLLTAALFTRSFREGTRTDIGFDPDGMVVATLDLGPPLEYDRERGYAFFRTLMDGVRNLPGVRDVAVSQYALLSGSQSRSATRKADDPDSTRVSVSYNSVSPGFFQTTGVRIIAGRGFTEADDAGAPRVVVINRTLADRLWPGESPIGRMVEGLTGNEPAEVIGVTVPGRYVFLTEAAQSYAFLPFAQVYRSSMAISVRAPGAEAAALRGIAEEVRTIDADVALGMPVPARDLVGTGLLPQRMAAQLVGGFGVAGLILAALGIYGVLAWQVARRTRELGVRRALGASRGRLVGEVVGRGVLITTIGCGIGTALGVAVAFAARSFLFGIRPVDPLAFGAVPLLLFVVALLASGLPAVRASAVAPSEALRSD